MLLVGSFATIAYYFCFYGFAMGGDMSTARWAWQSWTPENDLEHGPLILPAAIVVAWMHRGEIARQKKGGSWAAIPLLLLAVFIFLVGVWTVQPRITLASLPFILLGSTWFLWGWPTARKILFSCALLFFMVPMGFILGHTEPLQRLVAGVVHAVCALLHLGVERDGVTLMASDGSFHCEVAGGCSGIRSLMAMALLSAVYVHFTQTVLWKKIVIFAFALPCAVVGNIARVFSIVLFSKFISVSIGTGPYHDISGFIVTIPIALWAMVQFGNLLNRDWTAVAQRALAPETPKSITPTAAPEASQSAKSPISYDY